jgi:PAS domain-containing protein
VAPPPRYRAPTADRTPDGPRDSFGSAAYRASAQADAADVVASFLDPAAYATPPALDVHAPPTGVHWPIQPAAAFPLLSNPSSFGLPIYSSSGFDLLSLLARVANRPSPTITLGPVDLTCAFTVVDIRRFDQPIVYASPTFLQLTGYPEVDVIGRNCRFLQAPGGNVQRNDDRRWTNPESVKIMHKAVVAGKECQTSLINYKKGGHAFVNLVSLIPVPPAQGEEAAFVVGFQVDLTQQPNAILQRLKDGSYVVNYAGGAAGNNLGPGRSKSYAVPKAAVSPELRTLLGKDAFVRSLSQPEEKTGVEEGDTIGIGRHLIFGVRCGGSRVCRCASFVRPRLDRRLCPRPFPQRRLPLLRAHGFARARLGRR